MVVDCAVALIAALMAKCLSAEAVYVVAFGLVAFSACSSRWHRRGLLFLSVVAGIIQIHVLETSAERLAVFVGLYVTACVLSKRENTHAAIAGGMAIIAFVALVCSRLHNESYGDCLLVAAIASVPVPVVDVSGIRRWAITGLGLAIAVTGIFLVWRVCLRTLPTAMLEHGVWAKTEHVLEGAALVEQQAMYSYSGLKRLLDADTLSATSEINKFGEVWVVTPTQPFSAGEVGEIISWVFRGGRLVVVTDHTDFLGHARCANQLLSEVGMSTSDTALFPEQSEQQIDIPFGRGISLLTANAVAGIGVLPVLTARYIEEQPDYSGRNFFGPLSHSMDDRMRSRCVVGEKPYGAGSVCVVTDSTMFANFAIFSPDSQDLLRVVRTPHGARVVAYLMPAVLVALLLAASINFRSLTLALSSACVIFVLWRGIVPESCWDRPVLWSGDRTLLSQRALPDLSLSTAFSMFAVSGHQPRWSDKVSASDSGVWISREPPPNAQWRWLIPENNEGPLEDGAGEVLMAINPRPPVCLSASIDCASVPYGRLWSNSAFGSWWVDAGVSQAKMHRLGRFTAWCCGRDSDSVTVDSGGRPDVEGELIVSAEVRAIGKVPDCFNDRGEVYLGRGVSGRVELVDGEKVIVGTASLVEGWGVPATWVIRQVPVR